MEIMKILKNNKVVGMVGMLLMFIGTIAPFYVVKILSLSTSASLIKNWKGIVIILLIVAGLLFMFRDKVVELVPSLKDNPFTKKVQSLKYKFLCVLVGIIIGLVILILIADSESLKYVSFGWGFYVLIIGIILTALHAYFYEDVAPAAPVKKTKSNK